MNKTFIHIGCSFGGKKKPFSTVDILRQDHNVFAIFVEPSEYSVLMLHDYLDTIGMDENRYLIIQNLVAGNVEVMRYGTFGFKRSSTNSAVPGFLYDYKYYVSMFTVTLDMLVNLTEYPIEQIVLNCEGVEQQIVETYSFALKPNKWVIETHDLMSDAVSVDAIESILLENGYKTTKKNKWDLGYFLTCERG